MNEGFKAYKALGYKTHTKRHTYGHYFRDGKCLDSGLLLSRFSERQFKQLAQYADAQEMQAEMRDEK
jgi:hypothetical protein